MSMPAFETVWTVDMLSDFPDDDGKHYEILDGELVVSPSPGWGHQGIAAQLTMRFASYCEATNAGWLVPDIDIPFEPTNLVRPDLVVAPMIGGRAPRSFQEAARLLLVVEILSPSSKFRDHQRKLALYMRKNVGEYWIVDPNARVVHRWRLGAEGAETCDAFMVWRPEPRAEPLLIDLPALFERVTG
jgi:Uma2 family endonuclease